MEKSGIPIHVNPCWDELLVRLDVRDEGPPTCGFLRYG